MFCGLCWIILYVLVCVGAHPAPSLTAVVNTPGSLPCRSLCGSPPHVESCHHLLEFAVLSGALAVQTGQVSVSLIWVPPDRTKWPKSWWCIGSVQVYGGVSLSVLCNIACESVGFVLIHYEALYPHPHTLLSVKMINICANVYTLKCRVLVC